MSRNVYSSAVFAVGWTYLYSNFTYNSVVPIYHSWYQKTIDTGLLEGEDRIPRFDIIPECDGQTDGRKDGRICHSIFAASCKTMPDNEFE